MKLWKKWGVSIWNNFCNDDGIAGGALRQWWLNRRNDPKMFFYELPYEIVLGILNPIFKLEKLKLIDEYIQKNFINKVTIEQQQRMSQPRKPRKHRNNDVRKKEETIHLIDKDQN